ncbi:MAG: ion transporter [Planctomycetes bacterium]|nr:ion transporter [Planctomycetota bacterium]
MRKRLYEVIFEADTPAGKAFDVALLIAIVTSVLALMLESVAEINAHYGPTLRAIEWAFTVLFTLEYVLRLACVQRPARYALSFFGIIDLLAVLPTYASLLVPGSHALATVRIFRVVRVFRVLKLARFIGESHALMRALRASFHKITVFLVVVISLVVVTGSLMYYIEGPDNRGFTDIPTSVYWAIVTVTTVGFGDITPQSPLGRGIASLLMIAGYGIIAVPTGIFAAEFARLPAPSVSTQVCPSCLAEGHDPQAVFCYACGSKL